MTQDIDHLVLEGTRRNVVLGRRVRVLAAGLRARLEETRRSAWGAISAAGPDAQAYQLWTPNEPHTYDDLA